MQVPHVSSSLFSNTDNINANHKPTSGKCSYERVEKLVIKSNIMP